MLCHLVVSFWCWWELLTCKLLIKVDNHLMLDIPLFNHRQYQLRQSHIIENICLKELNLLLIFFITNYRLIPIDIDEAISIILALDFFQNDLRVFLLEVFFKFFVDHVSTFVPYQRTLRTEVENLVASWGLLRLDSKGIDFLFCYFVFLRLLLILLVQLTSRCHMYYFLPTLN